jgi:hypothetical protein
MSHIVDLIKVVYFAYAVGIPIPNFHYINGIVAGGDTDINRFRFAIYG